LMFFSPGATSSTVLRGNRKWPGRSLHVLLSQILLELQLLVLVSEPGLFVGGIHAWCYVCFAIRFCQGVRTWWCDSFKDAPVFKGSVLRLRESRWGRALRYLSNPSVTLWSRGQAVWLHGKELRALEADFKADGLGELRYPDWWLMV